MGLLLSSPLFHSPGFPFRLEPSFVLEYDDHQFLNSMRDMGHGGSSYQMIIKVEIFTPSCPGLDEMVFIFFFPECWEYEEAERFWLSYLRLCI